MEKENELKKPSFWDKAWSGFATGSLTAFVVNVPALTIRLGALMMKKDLSSEFRKNLDDGTKVMTQLAGLAGVSVGYDSVEQNYLREQNGRLKVEKEILEDKLTQAGIKVPEQHWMTLEEMKKEFPFRDEKNR